MSQVDGNVRQVKVDDYDLVNNDRFNDDSLVDNKQVHNNDYQDGLDNDNRVIKTGLTMTK